MPLIDLDRPAPARRRTVGPPADEVAALGVMAALVVLPGEHPRPAAPRPAPECTVFQANGPVDREAARAVVIDAATGRVLYRLPVSDEGSLVTFAMICPD
ncbi:hypothetical protein [Asanoa sp. NPDC050611]|uniref:hypothetical protein n=1 Tax=Asanoa sp. NPDC050611 TaxID=3157098 RepID=UPI0033EFAA8E